MNTSELKTTSFLLSEDFFGHVFRYKIGPRFKDAWLRLSDGGKRLLPYASLRTALAAHSNDFVRLDPKNDKWRERDDDWIFLQPREDQREPTAAHIKAWEFVVMESEAGELAKGVDEFSIESVSIADRFGRRHGACPSPEERWLWRVGQWQAAHMLSEKGLRVDDGTEKALRLDSEASLLTWRGLRLAGRGDEFAAIHEIKPVFIAVPGLELPVLHLQSSFVKLAPSWGADIKHAWSDPLAKGDCCSTSRSMNDGMTRLAGRRSSGPTGHRTSCGSAGCTSLRNQLRSNSRSSEMFEHEWARSCLCRGTRSVTARAKCFTTLWHSMPFVVSQAQKRGHGQGAPALARRPKPPTGLAAVEGAVKATGEKRFHIVILYGNDRTRLRLANALAELLEIPVNGLTSNANDIPTKIGLITVVFVSPPGAVGRLSGQSGREDVAAWAVKAICEANKAAAPGVIRAAIVETGVPDECYRSESDPKRDIRRGLVANGIVNQFLSTHSHMSNRNRTAKQEKDEDHPAKRAVIDMLRGSGVFLLPFPLVAGIPPNTWYVGASRPPAAWKRKWFRRFDRGREGWQPGGYRLYRRRAWLETVPQVQRGVSGFKAQEDVGRGEVGDRHGG